MKYPRFNFAIFDMDGVLVDSEVHWLKMTRDFLVTCVPCWQENMVEKITGMGMKDLWEWLCVEHGMKMDFNSFMRTNDEIALKVYQKCSFIDGARELLILLHENHIPQGLASSSPRHWIDQVRLRFGLERFFQVFASSDDVGFRGKPAPDVYLYAIKKMNVCGSGFAVEDSGHGVKSAKEAGLYVFGLRNGNNHSQDLSCADLIVNSFQEVIQILEKQILNGKYSWV